MVLEACFVVTHLASVLHLRLWHFIVKRSLTIFERGIEQAIPHLSRVGNHDELDDDVNGEEENGREERIHE